MRAGCPKHKLIVGLPTYGRGWRLVNANDNGIHAPGTGPIEAGPYTREPGFQGYNEICVNNWPMRWDNTRVAAWAVQGTSWIGYDNVESITRKCNYILENDLGGSMWWSLETDDFRGLCSAKKYPLIGKAWEMMSTGSPLPTDEPTNRPTPPTTRPPPTTPTQPGQTTTPGTGDCAQGDGTFPDRTDGECRRFYQCVGGRRFNFECAASTRFNPQLGACDHQANVQCPHP